MDQSAWILLTAFICLLIPVNLLVALCVIAVMLADTQLIPHSFIYLVRFVPMGVLCFRSIALVIMQKRTFPIPTMLRMWVFFGALALLSTVYSLEPFLTFQRALSAIFIFVGFGIGSVLFFAKMEKMRASLKWICAVMGAAILYSVYQGATGSSFMIEPGNTGRLHGIFNNPNTLGLLAMQIFFPFLYWWRRGGKGMRESIFGLMAVCAGIAVLTSGSRASLLGLSAGIVIFILGSARIAKRPFAGIGILFPVLAGIFFLAEELFPFYAESLFRTDTSSRTILWGRAWYLSRNSPFLGVGFGGSDQLFDDDARYLQSLGIYLAGAHSSFSRLLVDLGFVGLMMSVCFFLAILRRCWKRLPHFDDPLLGLSLLAVVAGSLVNSFFEAWLFGFGSSSTIPFWLFLAFLSEQADQVGLKNAGLDSSIGERKTAATEGGV